MNSTNTLNEYLVEDNVPVPRRSRRSKYPFATMQPHQSVVVLNKSYAAMIGVLRKHKSEGKIFVIRAIPGGMRIWRTA